MKKITIIFLAFVLTSCYVSKGLERDVNVILNEDFFVTVSNTGNEGFSERYNKEEYKAAFLEGMKAEFTGNHILITESNAEFVISITELTITESSRSHTVTDTESPDNGKVYELSSLKASSKGKVDNVNGAPVDNWSADKNKDEKVTSLRSAGEIVTGENKSSNSYREKKFNESKALDLARKCGSRAGIRIANDIAKLVN